MDLRKPNNAEPKVSSRAFVLSMLGLVLAVFVDVYVSTELLPKTLFPLVITMGCCYLGTLLWAPAGDSSAYWPTTPRVLVGTLFASLCLLNLLFVFTGLN